MTALTLGNKPDTLTVQVVINEPWRAGIRLVGYTWPEAPILVLNGETLTAELSESDTLAVWSMTIEGTQSLSDGVAGIKVEDVTWWKGVLLCQL